MIMNTWLGYIKGSNDDNIVFLDQNIGTDISF